MRPCCAPISACEPARRISESVIAASPFVCAGVYALKPSVEQLVVSRDDVVAQRPEDVRFIVPVFHTVNACCGAATAYLLRRIAYRAGAYAPGIQEHIFHELNTSREGGSIEKVQRWFGARVTIMMELGYRLQYRRVAIPTPALLDWVRQGKGYRGAMLPTNFRRIHPGPKAGGDESLDNNLPHAVGIS